MNHEENQKQDDDLDAFFDEISALEAKVSDEVSTADVISLKSEQKLIPQNDLVPILETIEPPSNGTTKKRKRPVGIVVASSSSKITDPTLVVYREPVSNTMSLPPPPPPPPPLPSVLTAHTTIPHFTGSVPWEAGNQVHSSSDQALSNSSKKPHIRTVAGKVWKDSTLTDWPDNDFRLFVGNLSKDVIDSQLFEHFSRYSSLQMVKVIQDSKGISKGYGFVSLLDPMECARAMREMDQSWLSARPIQVKRSDWKDRELKVVQKKKQKMKSRM